MTDSSSFKTVNKEFRKIMNEGLMPLNKDELRFLRERRPNNNKISEEDMSKMLEELQRKNKKFMNGK